MATQVTIINGGSQSEVDFSALSNNDCFEVAAKQYRKLDAGNAIDIQRVFGSQVIVAIEDVVVFFQATDKVRRINSASINYIKA
jgi:hypothetical protein